MYTVYLLPSKNTIITLCKKSPVLFLWRRTFNLPLFYRYQAYFVLYNFTISAQDSQLHLLSFFLGKDNTSNLPFYSPLEYCFFQSTVLLIPKMVPFLFLTEVLTKILSSRKISSEKYQEFLLNCIFYL